MDTRLKREKAIVHRRSGRSVKPRGGEEVWLLYFFNCGVSWRRIFNATLRQRISILQEIGWATGPVWSVQNAGNYRQKLDGNVEAPSAASADNRYKIVFVANYGELNYKKLIRIFEIKLGERPFMKKTIL